MTLDLNHSFISTKLDAAVTGLVHPSEWNANHTAFYTANGGVQRPLNDKLQEVYDAKDFGVVADGLTDDTRAFDIGVAWVRDNGGGILQLPPGSIMINFRFIYDNVHVRGAGPGKTFLKVNGAPTLPLLSIDGRTNAGLSDVTLDGNGILVSTQALITTSNCTDCFIHNVRFVNWGLIAIFMSATITGYSVTNCYFDHAPTVPGTVADAIIQGGGVPAARNNFSYNTVINGTIGFGTQYSTFIGNYIKGGNHGASLVFGKDSIVNHNIIMGNTIVDSSLNLDTEGFIPKGMENWGSDQLIIGNTFSNQAGEGIFIGAPRCIIANNQFVNNGSVGTIGAAGGLLLWNADATFTADGSIAVGNVFNGNIGYGLAVSGGVNNVRIGPNSYVGNTVGTVSLSPTGHGFQVTEVAF